VEKKEPVYKKHIFLCTNLSDEGNSCGARGGDKLRDTLKETVKKHGLQIKIRVSKSGCQGNCDVGPNVLIFPENTWYKGVQPSDLESIIEQHIFKRKE